MGRIGAAACAALFVIAAGGGALARDDALAQAQLFLNMLGYDAGPVDGEMGGRTARALEALFADRGGSYDGQFSANEQDEIYAALGDLAFNGTPPTLDAANGRTSYTAEFDFVPARNLAAEYAPVTTIDPDGLANRLLAAGAAARIICSYNPLDGFPSADNRLVTYPSMRAFEAANRTPHEGNRWLEDFSFAVQRAAPGAVVNSDRAAIADFRAGLLAYSAAGTGLDSANLVNSAGQVIVVPDFATGVLVSTSVIANYVLARSHLGLTPEEALQIETWLDRLFETFPDSYFVMTGEGSARDVLAVQRAGNAVMLHALMVGDVVEFNLGARWALAGASFHRPDGSDRLGASRGFRAMYYQGTSLMHVMETYAILASQGIDADALLGDAVRRRAEFWGRAWQDNSMIAPYARENNAVTPGSDYRVQEQRDPSEGIDLFLAIGAGEPFADLLREARKTYEFERQFGASFNETCIAWTIAG